MAGPGRICSFSANKLPPAPAGQPGAALSHGLSRRSMAPCHHPLGSRGPDRLRASRGSRLSPTVAALEALEIQARTSVLPLLPWSSGYSKSRVAPGSRGGDVKAALFPKAVSVAGSVEWGSQCRRTWTQGYALLFRLCSAVSKPPCRDPLPSCVWAGTGNGRGARPLARPGGASLEVAASPLCLQLHWTSLLPRFQLPPGRPLPMV